MSGIILASQVMHKTEIVSKISAGWRWNSVASPVSTVNLLFYPSEDPSEVQEKEATKRASSKRRVNYAAKLTNGIK
jgi:hypothetical protein